MTDILVRDARPDDELARSEIVEMATQELRCVYHPREGMAPCGGAPAGVLVALVDEMLLGTAEYVVKDKQLYVQSLAVHPHHRGYGVCRALMHGMEAIAIEQGLPAIGLCAIEETGNVVIFTRLGFEVTRRAVAPNHVGLDGAAVMQVDMERPLPASR